MSSENWKKYRDIKIGWDHVHVTSEVKWGIVWGCCATVFAVAETVAIRSQDPHAPLSHHVRKRTRYLGKTPIGQVLLYLGAGWLHRHLYEPLAKELNKV